MRKAIIGLFLLLSFSSVSFAQTDSLEITSEGEVIVNTDLTVKGEMTLPPGFLYGLTTSMADDADHDITISGGKCRSFSDEFNLVLSEPLTKQLDVPWAPGDNDGGRFFGSTVYAETTYHLFLIRRDSDGYIDAGWDTDIDCGHIPSGYTAYRRIASVLTDDSSNILPYHQRGDIFRLDLPVLDWSTTGVISSTYQLLSLTVPRDIEPMARVHFDLQSSGDNSIRTKPTYANGYIESLETRPDGEKGNVTFEIEADSMAQIHIWGEDQDCSWASIQTLGWIDSRGVLGGK